MQKYGFTKVFSIPLPSTDWLKFFRIYYLPFVIPWVVDQKCNFNVIIVFLALLNVINRVFVTVSVNYFEHCHPPSQNGLIIMQGHAYFLVQFYLFIPPYQRGVIPSGL